MDPTGTLERAAPRAGRGDGSKIKALLCALAPCASLRTRSKGVTRSKGPPRASLSPPRPLLQLQLTGFLPDSAGYLCLHHARDAQGVGAGGAAVLRSRMQSQADKDQAWWAARKHEACIPITKHLKRKLTGASLQAACRTRARSRRNMLCTSSLALLFAFLRDMSLAASRFLPLFFRNRQVRRHHILIALGHVHILKRVCQASNLAVRPVLVLQAGADCWCSPKSLSVSPACA